MPPNDVGDLILLKLPSGLYFVMAWVDTKLDESILQYVVADGGQKVIMRSKNPTADVEADDMLFEMGRDGTHLGQ